MRKLLQLVSWMVVGVLLIGAVGLVVFATPLLGNRALIVRSGSMEPTIAVGDIVIVRPSEYHVGEAIAYTMPERENLVVTHRIVEVKDGAYVTKGDANAEADSWMVSEADVIGKELFVVPKIGHVLAFAKTKAGFAGLVLLPALVVILSEARVIWRELRKKASAGVTPPHLPSPEGRKEKYSPSSEGELEGVSASWRIAPAPPVRRYLDGLSARLAVILLMMAVMTPATWALFSDSATSTNNVFAAAASFGTDHLVISEVQIKGANANQDFVELYNPTLSSVNLNGWKLRVKNSAGTESSLVAIGVGESIPAQGFFLWANDTAGYDTSIGADVSNGNNLSENNSVALRKPDNTTVDQVAWGTTSNPQFVEGTAFTPSPDSNQSIERKAYSTSTAASMTGADATKGNGFDANDNATDFVLRATAQPQNSGNATEMP